MHLMEGSFYRGKPVSEIPIGDIEHFASLDPKFLKVIGWTVEDIQAVEEECRSHNIDFVSLRKAMEEEYNFRKTE